MEAINEEGVEDMDLGELYLDKIEKECEKQGNDMCQGDSWRFCKKSSSERGLINNLGQLLNPIRGTKERHQSRIRGEGGRRTSKELQR